MSIPMDYITILALGVGVTATVLGGVSFMFKEIRRDLDRLDKHVSNHLTHKIDNMAERVTALETEVANLGEDIHQLEKRQYG